MLAGRFSGAGDTVPNALVAEPGVDGEVGRAGGGAAPCVAECTDGTDDAAGDNGAVVADVRGDGERPPADASSSTVSERNSATTSPRSL